jgi:hypothetical protein
MKGVDENPVQIMPYQYDHDYDIDRAVSWINGAIGGAVVRSNDSKVPWPGSVIIVTERALPYCSPFIDERDRAETPAYCAQSKLGQMNARIDRNGNIQTCLVTVNYFISYHRRTRETVLRHEILHCLGLSDDSVVIQTEDGEKSIMSGVYNGHSVDITRSDIDYLKFLYGLDKD